MQPVILDLPTFTDEVDSNPGYGPVNTKKCGNVKFNIWETHSGKLTRKGDSITVVKIGENKKSIVFAPTKESPYGTFDF